MSLAIAMKHPWNLTEAEARKLQSELRERLVLAWDGREVRTVAGVDVALRPEKVHAAIVVLGFPDLEPLASVTADAPLSFPYIPGLLSFREAPAILAAWDKLDVTPDLVMVDGQGIAHPRGLGIASHLGLWIERPTIGVAKSRLYGRHEEPGPEKGDRVPLLDQRHAQHVIGTVLRSRMGSKPLYISPGHRIDVEHSLNLVLACLTKYRLPEPTRWAHNVGGGAELPRP